MANAKANKKKATPKKKQYTMVTFECEELFDGELELPDANLMPPAIGMALTSGRPKDFMKFTDWLEQYGSDGAVDVWESLSDEDEYEAFFTAWEKASSSKAPKSQKSDS